MNATPWSQFVPDLLILTRSDLMDSHTPDHHEMARDLMDDGHDVALVDPDAGVHLRESAELVDLVVEVVVDAAATAATQFALVATARWVKARIAAVRPGGEVRLDVLRDIHEREAIVSFDAADLQDPESAAEHALSCLDGDQDE